MDPCIEEGDGAVLFPLGSEFDSGTKGIDSDEEIIKVLGIGPGN